ncbi:stress-related protein [Phtheirospermum japonicum]|uniref:Stress-related protein n=1 Tax=Phtheirospermum japonicum TaxID=374723 RepID=A0A830D221_9LAMI|nr:stress-related protein [Phtheirospermum japonicum]
MAEPESRPPADLTVSENKRKKLKYLDFVQLATIYVIVCCSMIYEYAKENSGPLRPGVQTVEGTVKTVIGPVYEKFHSVPFQLLMFVDRKVDQSLIELDRHVPALLKLASSQACAAAHTATKVTQELASEVHQAGLVDTASKIAKTAYNKYEPMANELYAKYEPIAEQYAVAAWLSLNRLPLFSQVAHIMVPTAAYWAEKYNRAVAYSAERGYAVSYYLPLVPIERIAKTFGDENEPTVSTAASGEYMALS